MTAKFDRASVTESFADLTGQFEDAALIAIQGQGVRSLNEAHAHCTALMLAVERMSGHLQKMKRQLK